MGILQGLDRGHDSCPLHPAARLPCLKPSTPVPKLNHVTESLNANPQEAGPRPLKEVEEETEIVHLMQHNMT